MLRRTGFSWTSLSPDAHLPGRPHVRVTWRQQIVFYCEFISHGHFIYAPHQRLPKSSLAIEFNFSNKRFYFELKFYRILISAYTFVVFRRAFVSYPPRDAAGEGGGQGSETFRLT